MAWRPRLLCLFCALFLFVSCSALDNLEREGSAPVKTAERARISIDILPSESGAEVFEGKIEGAVDDGGDIASLSIDDPSVPGGIPGPDVEFILTSDGRVFLRLLADAETLPRGKEYLAVPEAQIDRFGMREFQDSLLNDRFLTSKPEGDDPVGTETIRGVETIAYEYEADVDEMADVLGLSEDEVAELTKLLGEEDAHIKMWMDSDGFIRRLEMPMSTSGLGLGPSDDTVLIRFEVFDYDGDFNVEVPPASKVMEKP